MSLVELATQRQRAMGLTDRKFADLLGVHDSLWTITRNGKRPIRFEVLRGLRRAFPGDEEINRAILDYLESADDQRELALAG